MKHEHFIELCKREVAKFESCRVEIPTDISINLDVKDVFVVWFCKTLQNSKALLSMPHKESYYYEFTMNGDKEEIYMDIYKKVANIPLDFKGNRKSE